MEISLRVSGLEGRLLALGLPRYLTRPLAAEVVKYSECNGPAWTVSRLKSLKNDIVRIRAGLPPLTWVRKNRKGGWYGVWGALRTYASKSDKAFQRVVSALMVYSRFKPSEPTPEHVEKFRSAVESRDVFIPEDFHQTIARFAKSLVGPVDLGRKQPLVLFQGHPSVKAPIYGEPSVAQDDFIEKEMRWLGTASHAFFVEKHHLVYDAVLEGLSFRAKEQASPYKERGETGPPSWWSPAQVRAGKVVPLTKDGGWKVRWIASPFRLHQLALRPLGEGLFRTLETLPWDCTFDQAKALPLIQDHLRQGKRAHAVDLSSATDHFPLSVQLTVLRALIAQREHVDLFEDLSRATWTTPFGDIRWTKGQPMGLYPSFASFALTHGLLLATLSGGTWGKFFVLGDDVVILDENLSMLYKRALELILECPMDPVKTISSSELTEFAGKIITPNRVIPQYKWRDISEDNFLDMIGAFGQSFERLLTRRQRAVYKRVGRLLPPYGVNHSFGDALPLERVVEMTAEFEDLLPEKSARRLHTSFLRWISSVLKPWRPTSLFGFVDPHWARQQAADLDERVSRAFSGTPFSGWVNIPSEVTDILEFTDSISGLPAVGSSNRAGRETTLSFYERVLGLRQS